MSRKRIYLPLFDGGLSIRSELLWAILAVGPIFKFPKPSKPLNKSIFEEGCCSCSIFGAEGDCIVIG